MKTNILVQYQGGGYDGCIWEWNYFYIDKQGMFHDIQSSGCAGISTKLAAIAAIDNVQYNGDGGMYIYDLNNEQDIKAFSKKTHAVHVSGVLQWFENYNDPDVEFFAVCSECGGSCWSDDIRIEGTEIMCYECYSSGECCCCESYVGSDNMVGVDPDEHNDFSYICADCKEYHDEERETELLEDLRWQSFCTGKPNMFSGVLREARLDNLLSGCI